MFISETKAFLGFLNKFPLKIRRQETPSYYVCKIRKFEVEFQKKVSQEEFLTQFATCIGNISEGFDELRERISNIFFGKTFHKGISSSMDKVWTSQYISQYCLINFQNTYSKSYEATLRYF